MVVMDVVLTSSKGFSGGECTKNGEGEDDAGDERWWR